MAFLEYTPNTTLFHYCSPIGFDGIVGSKSIWLTDLQFANDPKELILAGVVESLLSDLIGDVETPADLRLACMTLARRARDQRRRSGFHSFSLSLRGDQLPMWQEYTDRGRGFCIGFRPTAFNDMPLRIQKVSYAPPDHLSSMHDQVEAIVRPLVGHEDDLHLCLAALAEVMRLATGTKDDTWMHESEIRLVFSSSVRPSDFAPGKELPIAQLPDGAPVWSEEPYFRERNGRRVPYHVKPFGRFINGKFDGSGAIELVIVGPNNPRSVEEVRSNLSELGYRNFQVIKSRCAFR